MSKHTPGPWEVSTSPTNQLFIRSSMRAASKNAHGEKSDLIATITLNAISDARSANARLIAAAPELLEALKNLSDEVDAYGNPYCTNSKGAFISEAGRAYQDAMKAARAAIATAEGSKKESR